MKKRIIGVALAGRSYVNGKEVLHKELKRVKVKGWKVNPYIFIHKTLDKNLNLVRHSSWNITHIPTGYAMLTKIQLTKSLTLKRLIMLVDTWFPAWITKSIGKNRYTREEHRIRARELRNQITLHQETEYILEL